MLKVIISINHQHLTLIIGLKPLFMFFMDHLQVFQRNFRLLRSHPGLGSLVACLRTASEINYFGLVNVRGFGEVLEQLFIYLVFTVLHVAQLFHQLSENVLVGQDAALGDFYLGGVTQTSLLHFLDPSKDCVYLESEAPAFGLCIIPLEHVDTLSTQILPVLYGLLNPDSLWHSTSQNFQKSRLTAADVSLDSEAGISAGGRV